MTAFPNGLRAIAADIDLVVMDLWGCMHDGITVYPAALDALHQLKANGVKVALVSNAPRRIETVRPRLREMGIADDLMPASTPPARKCGTTSPSGHAGLCGAGEDASIRSSVART